MESEHTMIVGEGATLFAQEKGFLVLNQDSWSQIGRYPVIGTQSGVTLTNLDNPAY